MTARPEPTLGADEYPRSSFPNLPKAYRIESPGNSEPFGLFTARQMMEYRMAAAPEETFNVNGKPATAQSLLEALIDIYDDAQTAAPGDRCYVEGAWPDVLDCARKFVATHAESQCAALAAPAVVVSAEPVVFALRWAEDPRLNLSTIFDTELEAKEYAEKCLSSAEIVPLYIHPATPVGPDAVDERDAARYRWLSQCPHLVRALVLPLGYGYSHFVGSQMHGPAYLGEVLDEVRESGKDAWGNSFGRASTKPSKGAA